MARSAIGRAKAQLRRGLHRAFAVSALYADHLTSEPVPVMVRWHNKIARFGDTDSGQYADIIEGVERLIFHTDDLDSIVWTGLDGIEYEGIEPVRQATVQITDEDFPDAEFTLEAREPVVGPGEIIWSVVRE